MHHLCPHLLYVLQDHVAVPVKGLYPAQELPVVSTIDQYLQQTVQTGCISLSLVIWSSHQQVLQ